nr:phage terminase large subunit family protein [Paenibacillus larvae]
MNAITDLRYEMIVFKWSAQVETEAIHLTQSDISQSMIHLRSWRYIRQQEMADPFEDRLAPMYQDSPKLKAVSQAKSRDSGNSILHKQFPGGQITLARA